jgi:hypothetical protein
VALGATVLWVSGASCGRRALSRRFSSILSGGMLRSGERRLIGPSIYTCLTKHRLTLMNTAKGPGGVYRDRRVGYKFSSKHG